jgi:hypothetical protein
VRWAAGYAVDDWSLCLTTHLHPSCTTSRACQSWFVTLCHQLRHSNNAFAPTRLSRRSKKHLDVTITRQVIRACLSVPDAKHCRYMYRSETEYTYTVAWPQILPELPRLSRCFKNSIGRWIGPFFFWLGLGRSVEYAGLRSVMCATMKALSFILCM